MLRSGFLGEPRTVGKPPPWGPLTPFHCWALHGILSNQSVRVGSECFPYPTLPQTGPTLLSYSFLAFLPNSSIYILCLIMTSCSGKEVEMILMCFFGFWFCFVFPPAVGYKHRLVFLGLTLGSRTEHSPARPRAAV